MPGIIPQCELACWLWKGFETFKSYLILFHCHTAFGSQAWHGIWLISLDLSCKKIVIAKHLLKCSSFPAVVGYTIQSTLAKSFNVKLLTLIITECCADIRYGRSRR